MRGKGKGRGGEGMRGEVCGGMKKRKKERKEIKYDNNDGKKEKGIGRRIKVNGEKRKIGRGEEG